MHVYIYIYIILYARLYYTLVCLCVCVWKKHTYQALSISFPVNFQLCPGIHPQLPTFRSIRPGSWSSLGATISDLVKGQQKRSHQNTKGLRGKSSPTFTPFSSGFPLSVITHSDVWSSVFLRCCQVTDDPAVLYFTSTASRGFALSPIKHNSCFKIFSEVVYHLGKAQNYPACSAEMLIGSGILSLSTKIHGCTTRTRQWQHHGRIMGHPRQSCA